MSEIQKSLQSYLVKAQNCPCMSWQRGDMSGSLTVHHVNCLGIDHKIEHMLSMKSFITMRSQIHNVMRTIQDEDATKEQVLEWLVSVVGPLPEDLEDKPTEEKKPKLDLV